MLLAAILLAFVAGGLLRLAEDRSSDVATARPEVEPSARPPIGEPASVRAPSFGLQPAGGSTSDSEPPGVDYAPAADADDPWVGDLERWGGVPVRVVNETGLPIEGALVDRAPYPAWPLPRTDEEGQAVVSAAAGRPLLVLVRAFAHEPARTEVPRIVEEPLTVVLVATTGLRVRVEASGPEGLHGLFLGLRGVQGLFEPSEPDRGVDRLAREAGWSARKTLAANGGSLAAFEFDDEGEVAIDRLLPHVPIEVVVLDRHGHVLAEERLPGLARGELRELVIVAPGSPHAFAGRVVDEGGRGVASARVRVDGPGLSLGGDRLFLREGSSIGGVTTDELGRFELHGVWVDSGSVAVTPPEASSDEVVWNTSKPAQVWHDVDLHVPARFVLRAGRSFDVYVRDASGRPVVAAILIGSLEVEPLEPTAAEIRPALALGLEERAHFVVHGAFHGACRVRATVAGRAYEETVEPGASEVVITIPAHGSLSAVIRASPIAVPCEPYHVCLRAKADGVETSLVASEAPPGATQTVRWPAVPPGEYEVWLERRAPAAEPGRTVVSARLPVTIAPRETTTVEVALLE